MTYKKLPEIQFFTRYPCIYLSRWIRIPETSKHIFLSRLSMISVPCRSQKPKFCISPETVEMQRRVLRQSYCVFVKPVLWSVINVRDGHNKICAIMSVLHVRPIEITTFCLGHQAARSSLMTSRSQKHKLNFSQSNFMLCNSERFDTDWTVVFSHKFCCNMLFFRIFFFLCFSVNLLLCQCSYCLCKITWFDSLFDSSSIWFIIYLIPHLILHLFDSLFYSLSIWFLISFLIYLILKWPITHKTPVGGTSLSHTHRLVTLNRGRITAVCCLLLVMWLVWPTCFCSFSDDASRLNDSCSKTRHHSEQHFLKNTLEALHAQHTHLDMHTHLTSRTSYSFALHLTERLIKVY